MMIETTNTAVFSPDRRYRYTLWRNWADLFSAGGEYALFVGLNPSTADETADDPTIRRCIAFAKAWGFGSLCMANLFAYRATDPAEMLAQEDPVGPENDHHLRQAAAAAKIIVAAWGVHGSRRGRDAAVRAMLPNIHYLRLTRNGHPEHPLYLPQYLQPLKWG